MNLISIISQFLQAPLTEPPALYRAAKGRAWAGLAEIHCQTQVQQDFADASLALHTIENWPPV